MTNDDVDLRIRAWLDESAHRPIAIDPDRLVVAVEQVPQRRWFAALRAPFIGVPSAAPALPARTVIVVFLLLAALAAGALLLAGSRPSVPSPFAPRAVIGVPGAAGAIVLAPTTGGIWIGGDRVAVRVAAADDRSDPLPVPITTGRWTGLLEHEGRLWASEWLSNRVIAVDEVTGRPVAQVEILAPHHLEWADGIWVASGTTGGLSRIDPTTGTVDLRISGPDALLVADGSLWFVRTSGPTSWLVRADPATGTDQRTILLPEEPRAVPGLTWGPGGTCWVYSSGTGASHVIVVDPATGHAAAFAVPYNLIGGLFVANDAMWALVGGEDGRSARVQELTPAGPGPRTLVLPSHFDPDTAVVTNDSVWIPSEPDGQVFRFPLDAFR